MPEIFFNGRPFLLSDGQAVAGVDAEQKKKLRQAGAGLSHEFPPVEIRRMTEKNLPDMGKPGAGGSFQYGLELRPQLVGVKMGMAVGPDAGQGKAFRQRAFLPGLPCAFLCMFC